MVVKKYNKIKSRISVILFFSVMSVFFSGLFFCGCASDEKRQGKNDESGLRSVSSTRGRIKSKYFLKNVLFFSFFTIFVEKGKSKIFA